MLISKFKMCFWCSWATHIKCPDYARRLIRAYMYIICPSTMHNFADEVTITLSVDPSVHLMPIESIPFENLTFVNFCENLFLKPNNFHA